MNMTEKMRLYTNPGHKLKLKTPNGEEDTFFIKPLPTEYYPDYLYLVKVFNDVKEDSEEKEDTKIMSIINKENITIIIRLLKATIVKSFDLDIEKDKTIIDDFISSNFYELMDVMFVANSSGINTDDEKSKALDNIRQLQQKQRTDTVVNRVNTTNSS